MRELCHATQLFKKFHLHKRTTPSNKNIYATSVPWKKRWKPPRIKHKSRVPDTLNPNRSLDRLPIYFRLFPSRSVHLSFACRHLARLILSAKPATPSRIRQTICSTIHKICTGNNDRFGLKVTLVPPILSYLKQRIINPFHQSVRIYLFILSIQFYLEHLIAVHNTCL